MSSVFLDFVDLDRLSSDDLCLQLINYEESRTRTISHYLYVLQVQSMSQHMYLIIPRFSVKSKCVRLLLRDWYNWQAEKAQRRVYMDTITRFKFHDASCYLELAGLCFRVAKRCELNFAAAVQTIN